MLRHAAAIVSADEAREKDAREPNLRLIKVGANYISLNLYRQIESISRHTSASLSLR